MYRRTIVEAAGWCEDAGWQGMLVYSDNRLVDPWLVAQVLLENTKQLSPLVAIQPLYMHPYAAAKMVASYGLLYQRRIWLNMLAGGFRNDNLALDDPTPHDERYVRTTEYARLIIDLLRSPGPVTAEGRYYSVKSLRMTPPLPEALQPGVLMSGSSEAGLAAARALGAVAVRYPKAATEYENDPLAPDLKHGLRVGIIARDDPHEAWRVAHQRFPPDRVGQISHQMAMRVSDSEWHKQISEQAERADSLPPVYWMEPFKNYKTFCPYLVGSHEQVAAELRNYLSIGFRYFVLDYTVSPVEVKNTGRAFSLALSS